MLARLLLAFLLSSSLAISTVFFGLGYCADYGGRTISVPDNFAKIQDAVNAATSGDTIHVKAGNYMEKVTVNKPDIKIQGEDAKTTVIIGQATGEGFRVEADNVTISGFKLKGFETGILVNKASHCSITGNTVTENKFGIWISSSNNSLVQGNTAVDCEHNMRFSFSFNNTFKENVMEGNNSYNFGLFGGSIEHYFQAIDTSNTVNGKPIQYITNARNLVIDPKSYPNLGVLLIINSTGITVKDLKVSNNLDGILFAYVSSSTIQNVSSIDNKVGVQLFNSFNCSLTDSLLEANMYQGVFLSGSSSCQVIGNNITRNWQGILVQGTNNSNIVRNAVCDNDWGLKLDAAQSCFFYNNNIADNANQVSVSGSSGNRFDNGFEGNFWSNYTGNDDNGDAIGDDKLPHEGLDNYPLMGEYREFTLVKDGTEYTIPLISDSSIGDFQFNREYDVLSFSAKADGGRGFVRITLPNGLVSNSSVVKVNNLRPTVNTAKSNGTHTFLYFAYSGASNEITIGELPRSIIAEAGLDQTTTVNTIVLFNGEGSHGVKVIEKYDWNFGDGKSASGITASHTYSYVGNYTVTLEVTDTAGNHASDSLTVTVLKSAENTGTGQSGTNSQISLWVIISALIMNCLAVVAVTNILIKRRQRTQKGLAR